MRRIHGLKLPPPEKKQPQATTPSASTEAKQKRRRAPRKKKEEVQLNIPQPGGQLQPGGGDGDAWTPQGQVIQPAGGFLSQQAPAPGLSRFLLRFTPYAIFRLIFLAGQSPFTSFAHWMSGLDQQVASSQPGGSSTFPSTSYYGQQQQQQNPENASSRSYTPAESTHSHTTNTDQVLRTGGNFSSTHINLRFCSLSIIQ